MKVLARVKKVLVGDSDLGFVQAVSDDDLGADFRMELPVTLARSLKRNDVIEIEVTRVRVPEELPTSDERSLSGSSGTLNRPTRSLSTSAETLSRCPSERAVSGEILTNKRAPRRGARSSPDPRRSRPQQTDPLRRLLGL